MTPVGADRVRPWLARTAALSVAVVATLACSAEPEPVSQPPPAVSEAPDAAEEQQFPDILSADLTPDSETVFDVSVTVSSPYDTPQRYADGWRVLTLDGTELGSHTLAHDHANEQPFTRTQPDLVIPIDVGTVVVEGRDLVYGYGGGTVEVAVPGR